MTESLNSSPLNREPAPPECDAPRRIRLSRRKKLAFLLVTLLVLPVLIEGGIRAALYAGSGFNPYFLKFGFVSDTGAGIHDRQGPGYSKFQPNVEKHQKVDNRTIVMRINSSGFRNSFDFEVPKPPDTFRAVAIGASSTFGYYVEDDQTYAAQLQDLLRQKYPQRRVEVFNLGVPHARSANCLALARHELAPLSPDAIILYSGSNDANMPRPPDKASFAYRTKGWLLHHSVAFRVVHPGLKQVYYKFAGATGVDPAGLNNMRLPIALEREKVEALRSRMAAEYESNVRDLARLADELNARLILVTQAYTLHYSPECGLNDRWRTYAEERDVVAERYAANGGLILQDVTLLAHSDMMDRLRLVASEAGAILVDGVAALDRDRSQLLSYVHLSREGNRMVAAAIGEAIVEARLIDPDGQAP